jgi:uncharacterized protein YdhG (YjbR/CyaY superfamily)
VSAEEVDAYIDAFEAPVQRLLADMRGAARSALPGATETIRYDIPTLQIGGKSVAHFGAWKTHLALYPVPDGDDDFAAAIAPYRHGKGTLRFPLDDPLPLSLIGEVFRLLGGRPPRATTQ